MTAVVLDGLSLTRAQFELGAISKSDVLVAQSSLAAERAKLPPLQLHQWQQQQRQQGQRAIRVARFEMRRLGSLQTNLRGCLTERRKNQSGWREIQKKKNVARFFVPFARDSHFLADFCSFCVSRSRSFVLTSARSDG